MQIGPETVMTTLYTAKKYAVPALEKHCVDFLKRNLSPDNAFMLLTQVSYYLFIIFHVSVSDPHPQDPHVFGPHGFRPISWRYGSGSGSFPFLIKVLSGPKNACEIKFEHKILAKI